MTLPTTMQAVRFHEHGGAEVLHFEEAPAPPCGPNDALIRVRACALNHLDIWTRTGLPGAKLPLPHILGADVAGEVAAVGAAVRHLSEGLECFVHPGIPGGPTAERLRGDDNVAADYSVLGSLHDGGYAHFVRVPADNVLAKPANLSWEETAAFPLTFLTAWHMLGARRAGLQSGETVLVMGANSGVGVAAIQFAKARGCRVIATAGNAAKAAYELTGGAGVDVVVEHVGPAVFEQCVKALKRGGRLVTCGATSGPEITLNLRFIFARHLTIYGSYMGGIGETLQYLPLVERGLVRPVVDKVYPLAQAADAQRRMEASEHMGKIVLMP